MDLTELSDRLVSDIEDLTLYCGEGKSEEALQRTGILMGRLATFFDLVFKMSPGEPAGFERETEVLKNETIPAIGSAFEAIKTGDIALLGSLRAFGRKASETGKRLCFEMPETDASEWLKSLKEVSSRTVILFGGSDGKVITKLLEVLDAKAGSLSANL